MSGRYPSQKWNSPSNLKASSYHELQAALIAELEDNIAMHPDHDISRRDALRFLASLPIEACGLSALQPVLKYENTELLLQCAAGITACWHLKKGKDLAFVADTVAKYVPTLKELVKLTTGTQRKDTAELLAQCFLIQSTLARHMTSNQAAIRYAKQAESYGKMANNTTLEILALRMQSIACTYDDQWEQALQASQQAKLLIEIQRSHRTEDKHPISPLVQSCVYAILATCQAYHGQKQEALSSLGKAHETFFAQSPDEPVPVWVYHNQGVLVLNDGDTHRYLGMHAEAVDSFAQIRTCADKSELTHTEALLREVTTEVNRDDQPRDMERCIDLWTQGAQRALALKSKQRQKEVLLVYTAIRAAWPSEQRIKDLRDVLNRA